MVTILHLSDLQFGKHHRFNQEVDEETKNKFIRYEGNEAYHTLLNKTIEDLKLLKQKENLNINIIVVSGDLAEWSTKNEYEEVEKFLIGLIKFLKIPRNHVVLVPGNHDVNWDLSEAYVHTQRAYCKKPVDVVPWSEKSKIWDNFLHRFYKDKKRDWKAIWYPYDFSDLGILLVGLNSCIRESHRSKDHYGFVGIKQIREVIEWFDKQDPHRKLIRIVVTHHDLSLGCPAGCETLNHDDKENILFNLEEGGIDFVLHGHLHESFHFQVCRPDTETDILGTGSAGLDSDTLPPCPNKYQVIKIESERYTRYMRAYDTQTISCHGRGAWKPDVTVNGKWKFEYKKDLEIPEEKRPTEKKDFDFYIESAQKVISRRLKVEKDRVESLLELNCSPLELKEEEKDLLTTSFEWVEGESNQFVLLGDAGSGKSVFCLQFAKQCFDLYRKDNENRIPILIDLKEYAEIDDALDILAKYLREYGTKLSATDIKTFLKKGMFIVILDEFDEYDKGSITDISQRDFKSFEHLSGKNTKLLITCRTTFFNRPDDIYLYDLSADGFELCPKGSLVREIKPLRKELVVSLLKDYIEKPKLPEWLVKLASRPLFLRMLIPLLKNGRIDLSEKLKRYQLYEEYIRFLIGWDIKRRNIYISINYTRSLLAHTALAVGFLNNLSPSISEPELGELLCDTLGISLLNDSFEDYLNFFKLSSLFYHDNLGKIYFMHRSFREYLVAYHIFKDYIKPNDDSFDWIWFTRDERSFLSEMITSDREINTLRKWLKNDGWSPACNYAAFILGGLKNPEEIKYLKEKFDDTNSSIAKLNCINSITLLGDKSGKDFIAGIVEGYLISKNLIDLDAISPNVPTDSLHIFEDIKRKFKDEDANVPILHLCESIAALSFCGDKDTIPLLESLKKSNDKNIVDEAKISLRNLKERLKRKK
ncbi:metallophosphoesterase [bacterium]|nr:metallophosphoesterase [bacterium]MBU4510316.1 metallophosphoesterase [bacterium]